MGPKAFVIKYMPDLRQREPRNVGVVVTDGERALSRFIGEAEDGTLKGLNSLPGFFASKKTYRSWWSHWKHIVELGPTESLDKDLVPAVGSNYVCELAMVEIAGKATPLDRFLERAWETLISWEPRRSDDDDDFPDVAERLIAPYRVRQGYHVWDDRTMTVTHADDHGTFDTQLHFHYSILNGAWTHVRRLKLSGSDNNTWNRVHLAVATFTGLTESRDADHKSARRLALVQVRDDDEAAEQQMRELERKAVQVVPVDDEDEAARRVTEIVG